LESDSEVHDADEAQPDPPMSDFHKALLASLREIFGWPYKVVKVRDGVINDTGLTWNPDYWVEKDGRKVLVISVLNPKTIAADLDNEMRKAFAVMTSNWFYNDKIALSAHHGVVIIPTDVSKELDDKKYLKYHYMFENVECQIIRQPNIVELELYRDAEDRKGNPIRWAQRNTKQGPAS
jgi:hypothetical protein